LPIEKYPILELLSMILTIIAVYSGRHIKITISKGVSIEANIPSASLDTNNSKSTRH